MEKDVYLIDASIYIFRAWFSVPDSLKGENGQAVNAVYGFSRFLTEFVERTQATHIGVAFDESLTTSFRNDLYPPYKMNRELPPADLERQFVLCRRVAEAAGLFCVSHDRYEADDLIATMAKTMRESGYRNIIVSRDKDLTQILRGSDLWWDFAGDTSLDSAQVQEKFGVAPEAIQDYLGLCGDSVDNIPGVAGVGPKTASALLEKFESIERLYENLDQIASLKIRGAKSLASKLIKDRDQAFLSKELATVAYNAPVAATESDLKRKSAVKSEFHDLQSILGNRGDGLFKRLNLASQAITRMNG